MKYLVETTDTFGREANYAWCRRETMEVPDDISDLALVRRAKSVMGWTNLVCRKENIGEMIALYPYALCQVMFIVPQY